MRNYKTPLKVVSGGSNTVIQWYSNTVLSTFASRYHVETITVVMQQTESQNKWALSLSLTWEKCLLQTLAGLL